MRRDADARTPLQHRALDDPPDLQLPRDLRQRFLRVAIPHDRRPGCDPQRADGHQAADQLVGHSISEELLRSVSRKVRQGQHGQ